MIFQFCARLRMTTTASDQLFYFHVPWFHSEKVLRIPVGGYIGGAGIHPSPFFSWKFQYLELQRRCAFFFGDLVSVRRRWTGGVWGARADWFSPRRSLVELVVVVAIVGRTKFTFCQFLLRSLAGLWWWWEDISCWSPDCLIGVSHLAA